MKDAEEVMDKLGGRQVRTKELLLSNNWRVWVEWQRHEGDGPYVVDFELYRQNGEGFELEVKGQVKRIGCVDIGFGQPTMIHFCDRSDTTIFTEVFDFARKCIQEEDERLYPRRG